MSELIKQQIWQWVDDVIIGLNLCPFAKKPRINKQIRLHISFASNDETLLSDFMTELEFISKVDATDKDTTLFVIANALTHFDDYLNFF